jgi:hypothetical protein
MSRKDYHHATRFGLDMWKSSITDCRNVALLAKIEQSMLQELFFRNGAVDSTDNAHSKLTPSGDSYWEKYE